MLFEVAAKPIILFYTFIATLFIMRKIIKYIINKIKDFVLY